MAALLESFQPATGCILLLDGWSPMPVGERASLADIVAVGVVRRTFKSERTDDGAATYSAEVRLEDVFKSRQLVDGLPYQPEEHHFTSGDIRNASTSSGVTQVKLSNSSGES